MTSASEDTDMRDVGVDVRVAASALSSMNARLEEASADVNRDTDTSAADVDDDTGMSTEMIIMPHTSICTASTKDGMNTVINIATGAGHLRTSQIDRTVERDEGLQSDLPKGPGNMDLRKVSPLACTVLWISLGISMIMFNKKILAPRTQGGWNFGHPFFLTMLHQGFATFATILLERFTPLLASVKENKLSSAAYWRNVAPLALFFSLGLVLGNSAYKYLSVSYIQMIKSCLPIPTLFMTYLMGRENPTSMQVFLVGVICVGAMMASFGELHFSMIGFILQGCALCADVGRMLFLDQLTQEVKLDNLSTLYYMAPLSCGFIFIGFLIFEFSTFHGTYYTYKDPVGADPTLDIIEFYPWYFPLLLLANAMLAFVLNLSIVLLVTNVGIMGMTLAGILKDVLVVILSVIVFGAFSKVTDFQIVGYGISLTGLTLYKELKKPDGELTRWLARVVQTLEHASHAEQAGLSTTSLAVVTTTSGIGGTKKMTQRHGDKWVTRCVVVYKCIVAVTSCFSSTCSKICPRRTEGGTGGFSGQGENEDDRPAVRAHVSNTTHANRNSSTSESANYIYETLEVEDDEEGI